MLLALFDPIQLHEPSQSFLNRNRSVVLRALLRQGSRICALHSVPSLTGPRFAADCSLREHRYGAD